MSRYNPYPSPFRTPGRPRGLVETVLTGAQILQRSTRPSLRALGLAASSVKGVTQQHDVSNQYRRRKMPWSKKKQWVTFTKRVQAVTETNFPSQVLIMNRGGIIEQPYTGFANRAQAYGICASLYTGNGNAGFRDMRRIIDQIDGWAPLAGGTTNKYKVHITGTVLDVTLRNTSYTGLSSAPVLLTTSPVEVDVYLIVKYNEEANALDPTTDIVAGLSSVQPIAGFGSVVAGNTLGSTPFEWNVGSRGYRILSKKKYFIGSGQTVTFQHKNPKSFWISSDNYGTTATTSFNENKNPLFWVVVAKLPALGAGDGVDNNTQVVPQITFGETRRYTYRAEGAPGSAYTSTTT